MNTLRISNSSEDVSMSKTQRLAFGVPIWVFIGIFSGSMLGIEDNSWCVELDNNILSRII